MSKPRMSVGEDGLDDTTILSRNFSSHDFEEELADA
jgi:hypothetical protein